MEELVYDEAGQLLTGSFMDYCIPKCDDVPSISVALTEHRSVINPLGVGVVIEARHLCMMMRGVEKQHSAAVTSSMLGCASIRSISGDSTAQHAPTWSARVDRLSGTPSLA